MLFLLEKNEVEYSIDVYYLGKFASKWSEL